MTLVDREWINEKIDEIRQSQDENLLIAPDGSALSDVLRNAGVPFEEQPPYLVFDLSDLGKYIDLSEDDQS